MGLLSKKKGKEVEKSQYEKDVETKGPNISSYEDDPLLNMEPVFADDFAAQAQSKFIQDTHSGSPISGNPLSDIIKKHREKNPSESQEKVPLPKGPLGDIIGNARKKSGEIAQDVIDKDPVIAKMKKIEELLKTGGTDADLYTDVTKSQVGYYSQRAKEFIEQQVTKKPESDAERIARMARETKERGVNNYTPNHEDKTFEIKSLISSVRNRDKNDSYDNDIKKRAMELMQTSSKEAQERKLTQIDGSNNIFSITSREQFNLEKRLDNVKEKLDIKDLASEYENKTMTPEQIEELEEKIKKKIEKIQKHKAALAKKEEKVMKLIVETDAKASSNKIAQLLEQRTVELEVEANRLEEREKELEKTIADLKCIIMPRRKKKK